MSHMTRNTSPRRATDCGEVTVTRCCVRTPDKFDGWCDGPHSLVGSDTPWLWLEPRRLPRIAGEAVVGRLERTQPHRPVVHAGWLPDPELDRVRPHAISAPAGRAWRRGAQP